MKRLAVLGAGSWGTALAISLASRFDVVRLWARSESHATEIRQSRENKRYLPGFVLSANIAISNDIAATVRDADILLSAVPSSHLRSVIRLARADLPAGIKLVSASKGIEEESLCRMSEVIAETLSEAHASPVAVLSGPTFAREVAIGEPAAVVIACADLGAAEAIQRAFATKTLRLYTSTDVVGVETGGALKNVIALGAGVCSGLGLGSNSVAALVTRGLAEITRLAVKLGGQAGTLSGLTGLGDLVLTATGDLSRNRFVGIQLGQGRKLREILESMTMVAEGVGTCRAAYRLGLERQVDLPITSQMYEVLYRDKEPQQAIQELMERPLTSEQAHSLPAAFDPAR